MFDHHKNIQWLQTVLQGNQVLVRGSHQQYLVFVARTTKTKIITFSTYEGGSLVGWRRSDGRGYNDFGDNLLVEPTPEAIENMNNYHKLKELMPEAIGKRNHIISELRNARWFNSSAIRCQSAITALNNFAAAIDRIKDLRD